MDLHTPHPTTPSCHVVALPFPGRGHINPMMCLCHSIAAISPDTTVSFILTEEWLGFIGSDPKPDNVRFITIPQVIPSEIGRGKDSPSFYETVLKKIRAPVEDLLDRLVPPVTALIADTYLVWSVEIGNVRNIPVASLWTMSASVYSVFQYFDLLVQNQHFPVNLAESGEERVDYIPGLPSTRVADLPTCFYGKGLNVLNRALESISCLSKAQCLLLPSVYELEPEVIDALRQSVPIPVYHIGPTIPCFKVEAHSMPNEDHYFDWLDKQPRGSVLYVSQGSLHSAPQAQMDEIAAGLQASGVRFFWVAREEVSKLKEKCGNMGIVVPWCDQLKVLCHSSLGGFWSHCGWNSTSEAVFAGLPMLTFPIYWDQVPNSKMIVEDWKIGWRVKKGSGEEGLVSREEIGGLVKIFMDLENEEGKEMRRRARELSEIYKQAIRKGGSSYNSVEAFISDISKMK
ncbi:putative indole-3-acetate beta-glucosyltransferase [Rosa chinensis]|uniref:Putative indole-3-acetate beta-glucosyltransferase n=1 Tax=Rosa chinensis TaxID=74649 RepID=A0A2P6QKD6_ROSCH|nr:UDP-glycosyltransferase 87A1 [Rosa chinensis]PRQ34643.1 putative indole-3-acetate beta-glucosyltransferase [Rosa chinensis]